MTLLLFGIAREIVGAPRLILPEPAAIQTVADLRAWLVQTYPAFSDLRSLAVAVDQTYATDDQSLENANEIALIPPVSGG
jgi:molybdopterin converting factor subunit 1